MKKKSIFNVKSSDSPEVLSSKKERLESFLKSKDEMNSIRLMLSIPNGCNIVLKNGIPIFEHAWNNEMLTLCNAIVDCPYFNPNASCGGTNTGCPISHCVYIDTFDETIPEWKYNLYFNVADKIFRHKNTDFTLLDENKDVGMNLLMYIAENASKIEYFINILEIAVKKAMNDKKFLDLFSSDVDGYTFITHALYKSNFAFIDKVNKLLPEYDLTEKDLAIIDKCKNILRTVTVNYRNINKNK